MALIDNILAYWKLDDDLTEEVSSFSLTATGSPSFGTGIINNGIDLEQAGADQFLSRAAGDLYPTLPFSVNIWCKPETLGTVAYLINKWADTAGRARYSIRINSDNKVFINVRETVGVSRSITSTSTVSTGNWFMLTLVANATDLRLYFNGTEEGTSVALTAVFNDAEQPLYLGANGAGVAQFFDGVLDEGAIWGKGLTSTEVTELYNTGAGLQYPFIVLIDETDTATLTDTLTLKKSTSKTFSETATLTDTLTLKKSFNKIFTETTTLTDTLAVIHIPFISGLSTKYTVNGSIFDDVLNANVINTVSTNNSSSTFNINIDNFNGRNTNIFTIGDTIEIFAGIDVAIRPKIFSGILEDIKFPSKKLKENIILSGRDFSARLMDRTVEPEVYTNLLAGSIVKDIINKYTDDITVNNVDDSSTIISRIAFTHKPVYDAIKQLADLADFSFSVDTDKDLNFKLKSATSSGKTFNSGNVISANIKEKRDTVFNEVWVYGDRYLDSFREEFTAGSPLGGSVFTLENRPHNTIIDVGSPIIQSTRKKGGIFGLNIIPPSGTDYLVNFFDKEIIFVSGTTLGYSSIPASGTLVTIDYQRSLPLVKVGQDPNSIATYGKRIKVVLDNEIKDPTTAQKILDRTLLENKNPKKQGIIIIDGLETITAGQTAVVDLPNQGINNQTYEILEVKHDFNKVNNLTKQVLTLKLNKKIDDITDTIKDLINDVKDIRTGALSISDVLTRFQFTTGSFGIRQSGLFISSRTLGSSFILGKEFHGVTGATFGGILGSVVASGINFLGDNRSLFTIEFSGGFPTI